MKTPKVSIRNFLGIIGWVAVLAFSLVAQEKFIDVRQRMADELAAAKNAAREARWDESQKRSQRAGEIWAREVKPLIEKEVKSNDQFKEYFDRIPEVEKRLANLTQALENRSSQEVEATVNAIIWAISHHPRGFSVPPPRYSIWDWVFALGIGIGFCLFAFFYGRHLRRSYYRRYKKGS